MIYVFIFKIGMRLKLNWYYDYFLEKSTTIYYNLFTVWPGKGANRGHKYIITFYFNVGFYCDFFDKTIMFYSSILQALDITLHDITPLHNITEKLCYTFDCSPIYYYQCTLFYLLNHSTLYNFIFLFSRCNSV